VARMAEEVQPYMQLNSEATDMVAQVVNSLLVLLESQAGGAAVPDEQRAPADVGRVQPRGQ
jgi:hypothetical protein